MPGRLREQRIIFKEKTESGYIIDHSNNSDIPLVITLESELFDPGQDENKTNRRNDASIQPGHLNLIND